MFWFEWSLQAGGNGRKIRRLMCSVLSRVDQTRSIDKIIRKYHYGFVHVNSDRSENDLQKIDELCSFNSNVLKGLELLIP